MAGIEPGRRRPLPAPHGQRGALPAPETGGLAGGSTSARRQDGVFVAGDWLGPGAHLADAALATGDEQAGAPSTPNGPLPGERAPPAPAGGGADGWRGG